MKVTTLSNDEARRIALAAQGFVTPRPSGRVDVRHFRRVLDRIGLLQLDSVNVLTRSHHLPLFSRLGPYSRDAFHRWSTTSGELFEYWAHEACLVPVARYPTFRWRMESMKPWGGIRRLQEQRPGYVESVFAQVGERGPLTASDLDDPGERGGPWWGHGPGKQALEWLFASGRLTAYRTPTFGRLYDVPERVIPPAVRSLTPPGRSEAYRQLLLDAARHHGVGTAGDLADYHRLNTPSARKALDALASAGELDRVHVDGWRHAAYLHPEATVPRRTRGTALLSPFDSLIWTRDRVERLFGFRYRIEIYVPKEQRVHGYYVLPFLLDGALVARVDLKADRPARRLVVRAAHAEPDTDPGRTASALAAELDGMAGWLELEAVEVSDEGDLAPALRRAVGNAAS